MARLAARIAVRAGKWKSRLQMVELKLARRFFLGRVGGRKHEQQHARKADQCENDIDPPRPPPGKR
jgi:hypothetical protein